MDLKRFKELAGVHSLNESELIRKLSLLEREYQGKYVNVDTDVESIEGIQKRLDAASRALGLANRLSDPKAKKEHLSRVLSSLNTIRAALQHSINELIKKNPHLLSR